MKIDTSERAQTLTEKVADAIVRAATEGQLLPGGRLLETELAKDLGISRVPVREALRLLESQGVVVNVPYRGIHLFESDEASLSKLVSVRLVLESYAAELAIQSIRKDQTKLEPFEEAIAAMRVAIRRSSVYDMALADVQFHRAIYLATDDRLLVDMWSMMSRKMMILIGLRMYAGDAAGVLESHEMLLKRASEGDAQAFLQALRPHLAEVLEKQPGSWADRKERIAAAGN